METKNMKHISAIRYAALTTAALYSFLIGSNAAFAREIGAAAESVLYETADIPETEDTPDTAEAKREAADPPFEKVAGVTKLPKMGDPDDDGNVTSSDSLLILRASIGINEEHTDRYFAGDVDGDLSLTSADSLCTLRRSAGFSQTFANESLNNVSWSTDGSNYYAQTENGEQINGFAVINGYRCVFAPDGKLLTEDATIDGKKYSILSSGIMLEGWQYSIDGGSYYKDGERLDGWQTLYGVGYYFKNGIAATGWETVNGLTMYFGESGNAAIGWKTIDGKLYYFGSDHGLKSGLITVLGKKYYMKPDGDCEKGWKTVDGKQFYFTENGAAAKGFIEINGKTYYFVDENTLALGLIKIDGKNYYFDDDNTIHTGWLTLENKKYYFNENGEAAEGLISLDGITYEFDKNGAVKNGWVNSPDGLTYFEDNKLVTGEYTINGNKYNFDAKGHLFTGLIKKGETNYYNNEYGYPETGWQTINGDRYYFNEDGAGADGYLKIDEKWYFFENGRLADDPLNEGIVVFSQRDERWSDHRYGFYDAYRTQPATIGTSGCGILSYVNSIYYLTGSFIEPTMLADWSIANGHRVNGSGTAFSLYGSFANAHGAEYGFKYVGQTSSYAALRDHLMRGGTAVGSAPGHLIAVVDYNPVTEEFLILDSASSEARHTAETGYTWQTVKGINSTPKLNFSVFMLFSLN